MSNTDDQPWSKVVVPKQDDAPPKKPAKAKGAQKK